MTSGDFLVMAVILAVLAAAALVELGRRIGDHRARHDIARHMARGPFPPHHPGHDIPRWIRHDGPRAAP